MYVLFNLGGGFKYFYFHPYLGKGSNLTNIFQMGWNHQLDWIYLATFGWNFMVNVDIDPYFMHEMGHYNKGDHCHGVHHRYERCGSIKGSLINNNNNNNNKKPMAGWWEASYRANGSGNFRQSNGTRKKKRALPLELNLPIFWFCRTKSMWPISRWLFQICSMFTPKIGEIWSNFTIYYVSNGLVQPPTRKWWRGKKTHTSHVFFTRFYTSQI